MSLVPSRTAARVLGADDLPVVPRLLARAVFVLAASFAAWVVWRELSLLWADRGFIGASYDDEGYLLISLHDFARGGALYDDVYTQYGPAYYLIFGLPLRLFGIAPTHDLGRVVTALVVLAVDGLFAATVWRVTRSVLASALAVALARVAISHLYVEPMHPHGLCWLLTAILVFIGTRPLEELGRKRAAAIGVLLGLIAMTKLNIGLITCGGVVAAWIGARAVHGSSRSSWRFAAAWLVPLAVPELLTRGALHGRRLAAYGGLVAVTLGTRALVAAGAERDERGSWRALRTLVVSAVATVALVAVFALACGTSPANLWWGLVGQHAAFAARVAEPALEPGVGTHVIASLAFLLAWLAARRLRPGLADGLAVLLALVWAPYAAHRLLIHGPGLLMSQCLPYAWIVLALPVKVFAQRASTPTPWMLTGVAAFEILQCFPVAGTQEIWTYLMLPALVAIALHRAGACVVAYVGATAALPRVAIALWLAIGAYAGWRMHDATNSHELLRANTQLGTLPVNLRGASTLRAVEQDAAAWRWISDTASRAGGFHSFPAQNSVFLWSGVEPLTGLNTTFRPELLRMDERKRVAAALERARSIAFVVEEDRRAAVFEPSFTLEDPVAQVLQRRCVPLGRWGRYELHGFRDAPFELRSCARIQGPQIVLHSGIRWPAGIRALELVALETNTLLATTAPSGVPAWSVHDANGSPLAFPSDHEFAEDSRFTFGPLDDALLQRVRDTRLVAVRVVGPTQVSVVSFPLVVE